MKKILKKKNNKKGFTLVELLAVIVILAVLVVMAMPSVLKIMQNARQSAFETEVKSYLKAAQTEYMQNQTKGLTGSDNNIFYDGNAGNKTNPLTTMEEKDGYHYYIEITETNNTFEYKFNICNQEFTSKSQGNSVKITDNFDGQKIVTNKNSSNSACSAGKTSLNS